MSIQLTNEQLMIYLENQNKQTQHNTHNISHRDPEKTGIHVFDKNRENIYEYLALFDTLVEGKFQGDTTKALGALLTRFTSQDILRLGSNVNSANYADIRDAMYSKLGAHLEEKDMSLTGMSLNKGEHITDYFTRLQHRWKGYNDWLTTEKRNTKTDNEFIEIFIETLPHQYRQILALEKVKGKIETIKTLQSIIDKYKFVWKNTQHTTQNNDLQKLEDQLQKTENTIHNNLLPKLTNIEQHFTKTIESKLQTYHNEITQQQQQLNEISTTNTKQFKEISKATEKTVELIAETNDRLDNENKYRSKLEHQTKLEQNSLIQQINNLQEKSDYADTTIIHNTNNLIICIQKETTESDKEKHTHHTTTKTLDQTDIKTSNVLNLRTTVRDPTVLDLEHLPLTHWSTSVTHALENIGSSAVPTPPG